MTFCADNANTVMRYLKTSVVSSYADLSRRTTTKVIDCLRSHQITTNKATKKFINIVNRESIQVFPKNFNCVYDKTSTTDNMSQLDLTQPKDLNRCFETIGIQEGDCTIIKFFKLITANLLSNVKLNVHFENVISIEFTPDWPPNVTLGRVCEVEFRFIPTSYIPIRDKIYVETVRIWSRSEYDLTFLQQFTKLKRLLLFAKDNKFQLSKPSIPSLEELIMQNTNFIINTVNLRELIMTFITIDEEMTAFISQQSRLLVLSVFNCFYADLIPFSLTLNALNLNSFIFAKQKLEDHLSQHYSKLKLRKFKTNILFGKID